MSSEELEAEQQVSSLLTSEGYTSSHLEHGLTLLILRYSIPALQPVHDDSNGFFPLILIVLGPAGR